MRVKVLNDDPVCHTLSYVTCLFLAMLGHWVLFSFQKKMTEQRRFDTQLFKFFTPLCIIDFYQGKNTVPKLF